jgi:membrane protein
LVFAPLTFALLFRFLPPVRLEWRHVWLASALCAVAWILGAEILASYAAYLGGNLGAYGAIGGLLIIMLWINIITQMLFFGAELCKIIASRTHPVARR